MPPAAVLAPADTAAPVTGRTGDALTRDAWLAWRPRVRLRLHGQDLETEDSDPSNGGLPGSFLAAVPAEHLTDQGIDPAAGVEGFNLWLAHQLGQYFLWIDEDGVEDGVEDVFEALYPPGADRLEARGALVHQVLAGRWRGGPDDPLLRLVADELGLNATAYTEDSTVVLHPGTGPEVILVWVAIQGGTRWRPAWRLRWPVPPSRPAVPETEVPDDESLQD